VHRAAVTDDLPIRLGLRHLFRKAVDLRRRHERIVCSGADQDFRLDLSFRPRKLRLQAAMERHDSLERGAVARQFQ
jgi:hypothetical protein